MTYIKCIHTSDVLCSMAASASCCFLLLALTFFNASLFANLTLDLIFTNAFTSLERRNTGSDTTPVNHRLRSFCLFAATSGEDEPHIAFPGNGGNSPDSNGYHTSNVSCNRWNAEYLSCTVQVWLCSSNFPSQVHTILYAVYDLPPSSSFS